MATPTSDDEPEREDEIRPWREGDGWVMLDVETGVATQGENREHALEMLDEAVALHKGDIGEPVTDEDLEAWGIDPDAAGEMELPEFMR